MSIKGVLKHIPKDIPKDILIEVIAGTFMSDFTRRRMINRCFEILIDRHSSKATQLTKEADGLRKSFNKNHSLEDLNKIMKNVEVWEATYNKIEKLEALRDKYYQSSSDNERG